MVSGLQYCVSRIEFPVGLGVSVIGYPATHCGEARLAESVSSDMPGALMPVKGSKGDKRI